MSFHALTFLVCLAFLSSAIQAHHLEMKDANRMREADANCESLAPVITELKALSKKLENIAAKCGVEPEVEAEVEPTGPACDPPCKNGAKCYKGKFCNCLPLGPDKFYGPQCDSFDEAGVRLIYGGEIKHDGVGRLEILVGGYWASVCADGSDEEKKLATAKKACAALGKPGKGKTYSGTNLQWEQILETPKDKDVTVKIKCKSTDDSFTFCTKKMRSECKKAILVDCPNN